jgi:hypothetical protein
MLPSVACLLLLRAEHRADQSRDCDEWPGRKGTMWMLVIILLNTVLGISPVTLLETYPTSQECHSKRNPNLNRCEAVMVEIHQVRHSQIIS